MMIEQTVLCLDPEIESKRMASVEPPLLARCRCGKLVWNTATDHPEVSAEGTQLNIKDQSLTSCSISAISNPDSTIDNALQDIKKLEQLCESCKKDIDRCLTSDGSTIWPPTIIALDEKDLPPRPSPVLRTSSLRVGGVDSYNTGSSVADLGLSYSRSDSNRTPLSGNVDPFVFSHNNGVAEKHGGIATEFRVPHMEGMSDDLLQILTDDSDENCCSMTLLAEVGINTKSLKLAGSIQKEEGLDAELAMLEFPWDDVSLDMLDKPAPDIVEKELNGNEPKSSTYSRASSVDSPTVGDSIEKIVDNAADDGEAAATSGSTDEIKTIKSASDRRVPQKYSPAKGGITRVPSSEGKIIEVGTTQVLLDEAKTRDILECSLEPGCITQGPSDEAGMNERSSTLDKIGSDDEDQMNEGLSTLDRIEQRMRLAASSVNAGKSSAIRTYANALSPSKNTPKVLPSPRHEKARSFSVIQDDEDDEDEHNASDDEARDDKAATEAHAADTSGVSKNTVAVIKTAEVSSLQTTHKGPSPLHERTYSFSIMQAEDERESNDNDDEDRPAKASTETYTECADIAGGYENTLKNGKDISGQGNGQQTPSHEAIPVIDITESSTSSLVHTEEIMEESQWHDRFLNPTGFVFCQCQTTE